MKGIFYLVYSSESIIFVRYALIRDMGEKQKKTSSVYIIFFASLTFSTTTAYFIRQLQKYQRDK